MLVVQGVILACPQSVGFIVCALASSAAHACMFVCRVFKSEMLQRCLGLQPLSGEEVETKMQKKLDSGVKLEEAA